MHLYLSALRAEIVWICTDYANVRIQLFGEAEPYEKFGKEFQIVTSSHRGNLDWIAGFILGVHYGCLHVREFDLWCSAE